MKLGHEPEPLTLNTFATETPNNLLRYIIMYELTKGVINKLSISIYIYIYILGLCSPLAMLDGSRFSCHATIIEHDM